MRREVLTEEDLAHAAKGLDGWSSETKFLKKRLTFDDFAAALDFVNRVGALAEAADHHPDITFGWGYAEIALTTHDRGGVTDVDVNLAKQIDAL